MFKRVALFVLLAGLVVAAYAADHLPAPHGLAAAAARQRAARVAAAWHGSAAQRAWSDGYYPLDQPNEWLPPDAFHSAADKAAYWSGRLTVTAAAPPAAATADVTWPDGSRATVPLIPFSRILQGLPAAGEPCAGHCAGSLVVTGIRPGSRAVATSRGQAAIPVWELTIAGYDSPFAYPAVASPPRPTPLAPSAVDCWYPADAEPAEWTGTSADGLTLTATVVRPADGDVLPGEVYETADAVVLTGRVSHLAPRGKVVNGTAEIPVATTFHLTRPLGHRAVLNLLTGAPETMAQPTSGHPAESAPC